MDFACKNEEGSEVNSPGQTPRPQGITRSSLLSDPPPHLSGRSKPSQPLHPGWPPTGASPAESVPWPVAASSGNDALAASRALKELCLCLLLTPFSRS